MTVQGRQLDNFVFICLLSLPSASISELHGSLVAQGPGSLCRAVFSKCCFGVLTNSSSGSSWDVSGLPLLSSSHVTLGEWVERAQQLQDIRSLLWTNMTVPSVAEFRYFSPWNSLTAVVCFPSLCDKSSFRT